jgi:putative hydrolase of the HAD superfamily
MGISLVLFDAADTLLEKPDLYPKMLSCFTDLGHKVSTKNLISAHRNLRERYTIPDKTGWDFYQSFNADLAAMLGLSKDEKRIAEKIYKDCGRLEWRPVSDIAILKKISVRMAIISNWDLSLKEKLKSLLAGYTFDPIIVSAEMKMRKPSHQFYAKAIELCKVPAEAILYVGDSPKLDIEPALRTGMDAVLIDRHGTWEETGFRSVKNLRELYDYFVCHKGN